MIDYLDIDAWRHQGQNIRVHGNRFLQVDLDPQGWERIHVWSDRVPFAQDYPTWIHDHVFGFHSRILAGTLVDVRYRTRVSLSHDDAESLKLAAYTYNVYSAKPRVGQDTGLHKTGAIYTAEPQLAQAHVAGQGYHISPLEFHATTYVGYAVTKIKKTETVPNIAPRILCPINMDPDNVFERYRYGASALWDIVAEVLKQARKERGDK